MLRNRAYYTLKPLIPRRLQLALRARLVMNQRLSSAGVWPIDEEAGAPPPGWAGWPGGRKFALVLTHDVDTGKGQERCRSLMELEEGLGFRSSFNFVPERYNVSPELRGLLAGRGFEVGVHGLNHDGKYFASRDVFRDRAARINRYIKDWNAVGYRSPSMQHNLEWFHDLDIEYDASTFDTDPFEPQPDGMSTIFPFWVAGNGRRGGYVEMPYTLPQDFTLFILMREKSIDIWKRKLDWVAEKGGMALVNTHPDYQNFDGSPLGLEEYPAANYARLLEYAMDRYKDEYWHALPREVAKYFAERRTGPCNAR